MKLSDIIKNKVVIYLASRYLTYFLYFVTSLVVASKLGPFYFGIWGFVLLLINYFQQIHFGIHNSFNVLYVQNRDSEKECKNYVANALALEGYLGIIICILFVVYTICGSSWFEKYDADKYVIWICLIAILQHFNTMLINLFRVKNMLGSVAFCQTIVVVLQFGSIFVFSGETLIYALILCYVIGYSVAFLVAWLSGALDLKGARFSLTYQGAILKKGLLLFLYNTCFYFIIISVRTIISGNYEVEEFGLFSFSFTLAHAVMLLLESLMFVIFPKMIGKMTGDNKEEIQSTLRKFRLVYISSAHGLIYLALIAFPLLIKLFPNYSGALTSMNLIALTVLMNTSGSGYTELLIARNKENILSIVSSLALVVNVLIAILLVYVANVGFSYVIIASLVTYFLYTFAIVKIGMNITGSERNTFMQDFFPFRLLLPYISALVISIFQLEVFVFVPFVLFVIFNINEGKAIFGMIKRVLAKPDIMYL